MPEYLYAYDEDGERAEDEIMGTKLEEHWYNPRGIGSGPYRFVKFERGVAVELERDPWYPLGGNAHDRIDILIVKDNSQHPRMLQKSAAAKAGEENPGVHVPLRFAVPLFGRSWTRMGLHPSRMAPSPITFWSYGYGYIGWNADKPYFSDKRVRWAMSHAVKADEILREIRFGLGRRTTGPITPGLPHYDETLEPIPL